MSKIAQYKRVIIWCDGLPPSSAAKYGKPFLVTSNDRKVWQTLEAGDLCLLYKNRGLVWFGNMRPKPVRLDVRGVTFLRKETQ